MFIGHNIFMFTQSFLQHFTFVFTDHSLLNFWAWWSKPVTLRKRVMADGRDGIPSTIVRQIIGVCDHTESGCNRKICWKSYTTHALAKGGLSIYHTIQSFNTSEKKSFWKHWGKRRKCWQAAISPFPTMFSTFSKSNFNFWVTFIHCLQILSIWTGLEFCRLAKS